MITSKTTNKPTSTMSHASACCDNIRSCSNATPKIRTRRTSRDTTIVLLLFSTLSLFFLSRSETIGAYGFSDSYPKRQRHLSNKCLDGRGRSQRYKTSTSRNAGMMAGRNYSLRRDIKEKYEADAARDLKSKQPIDISIPYDAAARLAYEASGTNMDYLAFRIRYETEAILDVTSKQLQQLSPVILTNAKDVIEDLATIVINPKKINASLDQLKFDLSIPYDAAAKLAYESSDKSMDYSAFRTKYETAAILDVIMKQPNATEKKRAYMASNKSANLIEPKQRKSLLQGLMEYIESSLDVKPKKLNDIKVPYDAAAKLAYVKSKQPIDVSIPYDAAAKLAYESSDKSIDYLAFRAKYEANETRDVISKQPYGASVNRAYRASNKSFNSIEPKKRTTLDVMPKQPNVAAAQRVYRPNFTSVNSIQPKERKILNVKQPNGGGAAAATRRENMVNSKPANSVQAKQRKIVNVKQPNGGAAATRRENMVNNKPANSVQAKQRKSMVSTLIDYKTSNLNVESKKPIDVSIPYDAAAIMKQPNGTAKKRAYMASNKSTNLIKPKQRKSLLQGLMGYIESSLDVKPKTSVQVPYDAAAKLAYESSNKRMNYLAFRKKYEADAIRFVKSKQPIDVSIPYDAAARLAYQSSDRSIDYLVFKAKYRADAILDVMIKQDIRYMSLDPINLNTKGIEFEETTTIVIPKVTTRELIQ